MEVNKQYTNEKVAKKYGNIFDLVNYSISLAGNAIRSGRGSRVPCDVDNPAVWVLKEIEEGKDYLDEIQLPRAANADEFITEGEFKTKLVFDAKTQPKSGFSLEEIV